MLAVVVPTTSNVAASGLCERSANPVARAAIRPGRRPALRTSVSASNVGGMSEPNGPRTEIVLLNCAPARSTHLVVALSHRVAPARTSGAEVTVKPDLLGWPMRRQQLEYGSGLHGLDQIVVESRLRGSPTVSILTVTGDGDEERARRPRELHELTGGFVSVHAVHAHVEEDDLRPEGGRAVPPV